MKILFASDPHVGNNSETESPDLIKQPFDRQEHLEFAAKMHAEKPDVLVVTGDCAESWLWPTLLKEFFEIYKNPHGVSIAIPGNHDLWLGRPRRQTHMEKFDQFFIEAQANGWIGIKDEPWSKDGIWIAGGMGWYDFSTKDPKLSEHKNSELDELSWSNRQWIDYEMMNMRSAIAVAKIRMDEFAANLAKVPPPDQRKCLITISHFVGFQRLLTKIQEPDWGSSFMGNSTIGELVVKAEANYYFCGHTHRRKEWEIGNTKCINNGSGYGRNSKVYDIIEV